MDFCLKLALSQNRTANLFSAKITKKKSLQFEQKIHYTCFVMYAFDRALL